MELPDSAHISPRAPKRGDKGVLMAVVNPDGKFGVYFSHSEIPTAGHDMEQGGWVTSTSNTKTIRDLLAIGHTVHAKVGLVVRKRARSYYEGLSGPYRSYTASVFWHSPCPANRLLSSSSSGMIFRQGQ